METGSSPGSRRRTSPFSGESGFSLTTRRPLMSVAIDAFLEGLDADAVHHLDEALGVAVAVLQIGFDESFDDIGNVSAGERRADDLAERHAGARACLALVSPDFDLVPLLAVLVDAEDADVPDVVVAAGIHAAGDVEVDLAD